ncbi:hypothetical protein THAOC_04993, partial [Thalassiosira oceanica]
MKVGELAFSLKRKVELIVESGSNRIGAYGASVELVIPQQPWCRSRSDPPSVFLTGVLTTGIPKCLNVSRVSNQGITGTTYGADGAGEDDDSIPSNEGVESGSPLRTPTGSLRRGLGRRKQHRRRVRIAGPFRHVGVPVGRRQVRGRRYGSGEGTTSSVHEPH